MADTFYVVAQGCSVHLPVGKVRKDSGRPVLLQGEVIPDGLFTLSQMKEHLNSKFIVPKNRSEIVDPTSLPVSSENRPGEKAAPPITPGKEGDNTDGSDHVTTDSPGPSRRDIPDVNDGSMVPISPVIVEDANIAAANAALKSGPKVDGAGSPVSKFIFDPATLEGKSVEELNVLLKECDPEIEPMDTAAEAVAFLTQDFVVALSVR